MCGCANKWVWMCEWVWDISEWKGMRKGGMDHLADWGCFIVNRNDGCDYILYRVRFDIDCLITISVLVLQELCACE